jgi:hypothetical protein
LETGKQFELRITEDAARELYTALRELAYRSPRWWPLRPSLHGHRFSEAIAHVTHCPFSRRPILKGKVYAGLAVALVKDESIADTCSEGDGLNVSELVVHSTFLCFFGFKAPQVIFARPSRMKNQTRRTHVGSCS